MSTQMLSRRMSGAGRWRWRWRSGCGRPHPRYATPKEQRPAGPACPGKNTKQSAATFVFWNISERLRVFSDGMPDADERGRRRRKLTGALRTRCRFRQRAQRRGGSSGRSCCCSKKWCGCAERMQRCANLRVAGDCDSDSCYPQPQCG